jgi:hypothetical protein
VISKGRVIRTGLFFAIANFLLTAAIGTLLRYQTMNPISDFNVRFWVHGHSHVGFLGWVFTALLILGFGMLLPKSAKINRRIYRLLIYTQIAVLGMLATFPFMGYAAPSILFSTFHMILSVIYVILFFKYANKNDLASKFMKAALVFMLISGLGPIALGPIMVMGLKGTDWYDMAIYFYLHFQYNGWFTLAVFALFIKLLEDTGVEIDLLKGKLLYNLLVAGTIMTLALSALGFGYSPYVRIVGFFGAALQLWAAFILLKLLFIKANISLWMKSVWVRGFFGIALFSWLVKISMQFLSVFPAISSFAYISRDAIMTYLHLSFLGVTSCFLIGLLIFKKYLSTSSLISKVGFGLFLVGIVLMEMMIGMKSLPQFLNLQLLKSINTMLFAASLMLFFSIATMLFFAFILPNRSVKQNRIS